jgi:tight adherence protein C
MQSFLIAGLWALGVAGLAWYFGQAATQITYVTLADGRRQERKLPLLFRLLLPLVPNVRPWAVSLMRAREKEELDRRLVSAGFEGLLSVDEYLSLRVLVPLVGGPVFIGVIALVCSVVPAEAFGDVLRSRQIYVDIMLVLYLFLYPAFWLSTAVRQRHRSMEKALPFVLDLMTLSVEAGLDFMTAMKRIVTTRSMDSLGEELLRAIREVQLGKTRREALRDMANRTQHSDILGVVHALVQADELGVSIGNILRIQSDQVRTRRYQRAEKLAHEAPVKMLFPLLVFIFPTVFLVLLGPVLLDLFRQGF